MCEASSRLLKTGVAFVIHPLGKIRMQHNERRIHQGEPLLVLDALHVELHQAMLIWSYRSSHNTVAANWVFQRGEGQSDLSVHGSLGHWAAVHHHTE